MPVAGGWSAVLLAAFYWAIDARGWKRWPYFFVVIGLNPITIYLSQKFIDCDKIAEGLGGGVIKLTGSMAPIWMAVAVIAVKWLFLHFLNKQRVYLRV